MGQDSFTRGAIYLGQNKLDKAEESFKRFITINPKDNQALWNLANLVAPEKVNRVSI
jgi:hypothetical protein